MRRLPLVLVLAVLLVLGGSAAVPAAALGAAVQPDPARQDGSGINDPDDDEDDEDEDEEDEEDDEDRAPVELAVMGGTVVDADSEDPVPGAAVFLLQPGLAAEDWDEDDEDAVYTRTLADAAGAFSFADPIEREAEYALCADADGYGTTCTEPEVRATEDDEAVVLWTLSIEARD